MNLKLVSSHIDFNLTFFFKRNVLEEVSLVTDEGKNSSDGVKQSKKMKWRAESFLVAGNMTFCGSIDDHTNFKIDLNYAILLLYKSFIVLNRCCFVCIFYHTWNNILAIGCS